MIFSLLSFSLLYENLTLIWKFVLELQDEVHFLLQSLV